MDEKQWASSKEINSRNDIDFNEFVALLADVNLKFLTTSKGFFDLLLADQALEFSYTD